MSEQQEVVIIGGGILGVSTLAHLARAGVRAKLVTRGKLADGASGRSIAWLNSAGARSFAYHYLRLLGLDRYRTWASTHPESAHYLRFEGAMTWAGPDESLKDTFAFELGFGYDAQWVEQADIAECAPEVDATAVAAEGAIFNPGEGWVDLPSIINVLVEEALQGGATVIESAGDSQVVVEAGVATGVRLADGSVIEADTVVLATGPAVPADLAALGVTIPDATPTAFVVITEPVDLDMRVVLNTPRVAVRPTPDKCLTLDADWATKSLQMNEGGSVEIPDHLVEALLEEASLVLAGRPKLVAQRIGAGPKPIPGDGDPVAGSVSGIAGLYTLFTHSGATLGLILGELAAEEIVTGTPSPVLKEFRPDRFENSSPAIAEVGTGAWTPVS